MAIDRLKNWFRQHINSHRLPIIASLTGIILLLAFLIQSPSQNEAIDSPAIDDETTRLTLTGAARDVVYICPMNCISPLEKPGRCPICGMELVPSFGHGDHAKQATATLTLDPEASAKAGIRVKAVQRKTVTAGIRLFGKIEYDPVEQYRVTAFAPGVIDRIYVKRAGQSVRRGDPLFDLHSSELFFLEQDLFEALKAFPDVVDFRPARGQSYKRLMRPARRSFNIKDEEGNVDESKKSALEKIDQLKRKMRLLGLTDADIEDVMARGRPTGISTVTTPTTGIILEHEAYKGAYVNTGETIFTVANPKYLWARMDAYESDFAWLRIGQKAEFISDAFPGQTFEGKVLYLDPFFDPQSRTFKVGVLYQDPHSRLKPNMLVRGLIHARMTAAGIGTPGRKNEEVDPLVIPETAPLITGTRAIVYVQDSQDSGSYHARAVVLGPRAQGYYVIREGLREGEHVVVNGNFKIDSAVQIQGQSSMMDHHDSDTALFGQQHPGSDDAMRDEPHPRPAEEIDGAHQMHHQQPAQKDP